MQPTPVLQGKKVVLFPFQVEVDKDLFFDLHRKYGEQLGRFGLSSDKEVTNCRIAQVLIAWRERVMRIWTVYTNSGQAAEPLGFVYLSEIGSHFASINGVQDPGALKVPVRKRKGRAPVSFAQESVELVVSFAFEQLGLVRIEADVLADNKKVIQLLKQCGFEQEGLLRKKAMIDGHCKDVMLFSRLAVDPVPEGPLKERKPAAEGEPQGVAHG